MDENVDSPLDEMVNRDIMNILLKYEGLLYTDQIVDQILAEIKEYVASFQYVEEDVNRYQFREIGEGGWVDCDAEYYEYAKRSPILDSRII